MKYNRSKIFAEAWKIFRKGAQTFAQALRIAWQNEKSRISAKAAAGITEEVHTWAGWKALGFEVIHESKAIYKVIVEDPSTKKGTRVTCFFGASQVAAIA